MGIVQWYVGFDNRIYGISEHANLHVIHLGTGEHVTVPLNGKYDPESGKVITEHGEIK
jgi:hypothetical protein